MTDLRKAAEAVLEAWAWDWSEPRNEALRERMEALRQALAQPEQEPVAWITSDGVMVDKQGVKSYLSIVGTKFVGRPLYTAPPSIEAAVLAEREACIEWLRNNYQDYKNISDICDAIRTRGEK